MAEKGGMDIKTTVITLLPRWTTVEKNGSKTTVDTTNNLRSVVLVRQKNTERTNNV